MSQPLNILCDYCGRPAEKATGKDIYPRRPDLYHLRFYRCKPCGAHVGCHANSEKPLGRLANAELRQAKMKAHAAFDPLWRSREMSRRGAYRWLSKVLGVEAQHCHIGMFDLIQCQRVVDAVADYRETSQ